MDLAQDLGMCDAYIEHQELVGLLAEARDKTCQWYERERKKTWKKVRVTHALVTVVVHVGWGWQAEGSFSHGLLGLGGGFTQACFANTWPLIANPPQLKKLTEAKAEAEEVAAATMQKDEFEAKCPAVYTKFYQLRALTTQDWAVPLPPEGDDV